MGSDFTTRGADAAIFSEASQDIGSGATNHQHLSADQLANLRTVGGALGFERGWLLWGSAIYEGESKPKQPFRIKGSYVTLKGWTRPENTHSLDFVLHWVGRVPGGACSNGQPVGGVGFMVAASARPDVVVLDFDKCIVRGEPNAFAKAVLHRFSGTYAEVSPSGTGLRIVCLAADPAWWPHSTDQREVKLAGADGVDVAGVVEVYTPSNSSGKFFRLSGNAWGGGRAHSVEVVL